MARLPPLAAPQMHGVGTYVDARLKEPQQFPVAARSESWNTARKAGPDHAEARRVALLSAGDPGATGAGRELRQGRSGAR